MSSCTKSWYRYGKDASSFQLLSCGWEQSCIGSLGTLKITLFRTKLHSSGCLQDLCHCPPCVEDGGGTHVHPDALAVGGEVVEDQDQVNVLAKNWRFSQLEFPSNARVSHCLWRSSPSRVCVSFCDTYSQYLTQGLSIDSSFLRRTWWKQRTK